MVAPMYNTGMKAVVSQPRTVETFENMMKQLVKESNRYVNPRKAIAVNDKKIIVHNPEKNPFAPLYRPDKEVLYKMDKYHQFEPPKALYEKQAVPEQKLVAAGADGIPPEDGDKFNNNNFKKVLADKNNNIKELSNTEIYKNTYKK